LLLSYRRVLPSEFFSEGFGDKCLQALSVGRFSNDSTGAFLILKPHCRNGNSNEESRRTPIVLLAKCWSNF
jgi:hypothetical protein